MNIQTATHLYFDDDDIQSALIQAAIAQGFDIPDGAKVQGISARVGPVVRIKLASDRGVKYD